MPLHGRSPAVCCKLYTQKADCTTQSLKFVKLVFGSTSSSIVGLIELWVEGELFTIQLDGNGENSSACDTSTLRILQFFHREVEIISFIYFLPTVP